MTVDPHGPAHEPPPAPLPPSPPPPPPRSRWQRILDVALPGNGRRLPLLLPVTGLYLLGTVLPPAEGSLWHGVLYSGSGMGALAIAHSLAALLVALTATRNFVLRYIEEPDYDQRRRSVGLTALAAASGAFSAQLLWNNFAPADALYAQLVGSALFTAVMLAGLPLLYFGLLLLLGRWISGAGMRVRDFLFRRRRATPAAGDNAAPPAEPAAPPRPEAPRPATTRRISPDQRG